MKRIKTILVPFGLNAFGAQALKVAQTFAEEVIIVGMVAIAKGAPVSAGAPLARQLRVKLQALTNATTRLKSPVIVSEAPWVDFQALLAKEKPDLMMLEWGNTEIIWGRSMTEILFRPACDVAIIRGGLPPSFNALAAVRGGPYAELALKLAMNLKPAQLDALHITLTGSTTDAPFTGLKHILRQMPEIHLRSLNTDDATRTILAEAQRYDVVVLGATASKTTGASTIGPVAERLLKESSATIIVVKTQRNMEEHLLTESAGSQAISILVDKWFAENTFHADEFKNIRQLMQVKEKSGNTISLALPALNEEETVGRVIRTIKSALMDKIPLLDEIILIDSNSTDRTRQIAEELGVPVFIHQELLPELGARNGKGEALWKSLSVTKGDILAWIDTDIVNIHPRFVYGIIGPLLFNPQIQFVKGFYRRPLKVGDKVQAGSGGRVTELAARPLLNLFYPELSGLVQPLSGEYAGRRAALEQSIFFSGYGVEIGLLIDIFERHGVNAIAQVDLLERVHHNQELEALSKMSFAIIQAVLRKLELRYERALIEDVNKTMKLIRYMNGGYFLDVEEIAEQERPPMKTIRSYKARQ